MSTGRYNLSKLAIIGASTNSINSTFNIAWKRSIKSLSGTAYGDNDR